MFLDCTLDREYLFLKQICIEYIMYPEIEGGEKIGSRVRKSQSSLWAPVGVGQTRAPSAISGTKARHWYIVLF